VRLRGPGNRANAGRRATDLAGTGLPADDPDSASFPPAGVTLFRLSGRGSVVRRVGMGAGALLEHQSRSSRCARHPCGLRVPACRSGRFPPIVSKG
jgi:hypothetical protein